MTTPQQHTIIRPDDWHVHLRDGEMLHAVLPFTSRVFGRAIVMPNLKFPVATTESAHMYRDEIREALPKASNFTPLMTVYLTDTTSPDDLEQGHKDGILTAAKLYPAHATTNSEHGVTKISNITKVLERMQRIGMPLLVHGEVTTPEVDIFDREAVFIATILSAIRKDFPELKIVLEHITTEEAAVYVAEEGERGKLAATITPHHLHINRNAMFQGGIRPHMYCLPVAKRERHRQALIKAATSGKKMFFLGTDTAPHMRTAKEAACGCAGIFCAPNAIELYTEIFDQAGALRKLEAFASRNGPAFYGLPVNTDSITLEKCDAPLEAIGPVVTQTGHEIIPFIPHQPLRWRLV